MNDLSALAVITISISIYSSLLTWLQFRLARKRRIDDLFRLRYKFYKQVSHIWLRTYDTANPTLDIIDLIPLSEEADFLFGKNVSKHIISMVDKRATNDMFPDNDFTKPFRKYLKLK